MEGVPLPPGIPGLGGSTDPLEAVLGPFPCARLQNLPYDATLEDILVLFQGLVVIDVILVGLGEAFVIFANPMDFQMALQRTRQTIGRRFIEISAASRADYYEAIAKHEQESGTKRILRVGASLEDVRSEEQLISGESIAQKSMTSLWGEPSTSGATQNLSGQSTFTEGGMLSQLPTEGVAGRSGTGTAPGRGSLQGPLPKRTGGGIQVGEHSGFLRMRGLPFTASKDDILNFFIGYKPVLESIVLTYRNDGRATGEAYVGFESPDDSKRAMELHRKMMGQRYIELFISNKEEHGRALVRFGNR